MLMPAEKTDGCDIDFAKSRGLPWGEVGIDFKRSRRSESSPICVATRSARFTTTVFDAGFGSVSYSHRAFRRAYGATPSDIRAAARREVR